MTAPALLTEAEPHDAHVATAHGIFRAAGFTLAAMQFPRSERDLQRLKRFNGVADDAPVPPAWHYHPNEWCARKAGDL
jgi:hypothetical protein